MKRWQADAAFVALVFALTLLFRGVEHRGYQRGIHAEADRVASEALGG